MKADRQIQIDQMFDVIDDEANGLTCLFPPEGEGSIADIIAHYGDDIQVVTQSATWFLVAEDGNTFCLEAVGGTPFIGSTSGIYESRDGDRWNGPNGDDLIATRRGWVAEEEAEVECYGARLS